MRKVAVSIILGLFSAFPHAGNASQIDLGVLLENMLDRSKIAEFPEIDFVCKQASSYDRLSVKPGNADWFANSDSSHFIGCDEAGGKRDFSTMRLLGANQVPFVRPG